MVSPNKRAADSIDDDDVTTPKKEKKTPKKTPKVVKLEPGTPKSIAILNSPTHQMSPLLATTSAKKAVRKTPSKQKETGSVNTPGNIGTPQAGKLSQPSPVQTRSARKKKAELNATVGTPNSKAVSPLKAVRGTNLNSKTTPKTQKGTPKGKGKEINNEEEDFKLKLDDEMDSDDLDSDDNMDAGNDSDDIASDDDFIDEEQAARLKAELQSIINKPVSSKSILKTAKTPVKVVKTELGKSSQEPIVKVTKMSVNTPKKVVADQDGQQELADGKSSTELGKRASPVVEKTPSKKARRSIKQEVIDNDASANSIKSLQPVHTPQKTSKTPVKVNTVTPAKVTSVLDTPVKEITSPVKTIKTEATSPLKANKKEAPQPKKNQVKTPTKQNASQATTPAKTPAKEAPVLAKTPAKGAPTPAKTPAKEAAVVKTPAKETATPAKAPAIELPTPAKSPAKEIPALAKTPAKATPTPAKTPAETPAKETPAPAKTPAKGAPTPAKTPAKEAPNPAKTPAKGTPTPAKTPAKGTPTPAKTPAKGTPTPVKAKGSPAPLKTPKGATPAATPAEEKVVPAAVKTPVKAKAQSPAKGKDSPAKSLVMANEVSGKKVPVVDQLPENTPDSPAVTLEACQALAKKLKLAKKKERKAAQAKENQAPTEISKVIEEDSSKEAQAKDGSDAKVAKALARKLKWKQKKAEQKELKAKESGKHAKENGDSQTIDDQTSAAGTKVSIVHDMMKYLASRPVSLASGNRSPKKQSNAAAIEEERAVEVRQKLSANGKSDEEIDRDLPRIMFAIKKRVEGTRCHRCRNKGHMLRDCPVSKVRQAIKCYKCGETAHTSKNCSIKEEVYTHAECFICRQTGHLTRTCPSNTNGIYPKGGACFKCGDKSHLSKLCPGNKRFQDEKDTSEMIQKKVVVGVLNVKQSADADVTHEPVVKAENKALKQGGKKRVVKF